MKKLLAILTFCACACLTYAIDPVKQYGQLQVKGTQLCDQQGLPVTLRGVSFGWHNWWPRFYNKKVLKTLKRDWHCTVVRAAIGVQPDEDPKAGYIQNPTWAMSCLTPIIESAIKQNVYIIIDWHSHHMYTREAKEFFGKMAQGCPHWDQDIHLVANSPLEGFQNVMYTVHFYAATHGDDLRQRTEDAVNQGIPVFISECGAMEASGDGPIDMDSEEAWIDMCERLGMSWVCWSLADKDETCSMLLPDAKSSGPWRDNVIKPYGKLVKSMLQKYNSLNSKR